MAYFRTHGNGPNRQVFPIDRRKEFERIRSQKIPPQSVRPPISSTGILELLKFFRKRGTTFGSRYRRDRTLALKMAELDRIADVSGIQSSGKEEIAHIVGELQETKGRIVLNPTQRAIANTAYDGVSANDILAEEKESLERAADAIYRNLTRIATPEYPVRERFAVGDVALALSNAPGGVIWKAREEKRLAGIRRRTAKSRGKK